MWLWQLLVTVIQTNTPITFDSSERYDHFDIDRNILAANVWS